MSSTLPVPGESKEFENCPAGNHIAVCIRVIDLGTQETTYNGEKKKAHQIQLVWEVDSDDGVVMADGRPFIVNSRRYTWSMHEKANLRKDLTSWRGKPFADSDFGDGGFDIRKLLGCGCMLNVIHNESGDKTYANVGSIATLPKKLATPNPVNPELFIWLDKDLFDRSAFDLLSDYMKTLIAASPEFKVVNADAPLDTPLHPADQVPKKEAVAIGDDVPF